MTPRSSAARRRSQGGCRWHERRSLRRARPSRGHHRRPAGGDRADDAAGGLGGRADHRRTRHAHAAAAVERVVRGPVPLEGRDPPDNSPIGSASGRRRMRVGRSSIPISSARCCRTTTCTCSARALIFGRGRSSVRTSMTIGGRDRRALRRLGSQCSARERGRRLQSVGRSRASDAPSRAVGRVGAVRSGRAGRHLLQVRGS